MLKQKMNSWKYDEVYSAKKIAIKSNEETFSTNQASAAKVMFQTIIEPWLQQKNRIDQFCQTF